MEVGDEGGGERRGVDGGGAAGVDRRAVEAAVLADCGGGAARHGLAALAGEDRVAARLSPPALVPRSECPSSSSSCSSLLLLPSRS